MTDVRQTATLKQISGNPQFMDKLSYKRSSSVPNLNKLKDTVSLQSLKLGVMFCNYYLLDQVQEKLYFHFDFAIICTIIIQATNKHDFKGDESILNYF